jgi:diguanylate cyclase (GGDEF)-like protein
MEPPHLSAFSRLRGLLEVTRLVRSDDQLDHLLAAIARTTSESLGYGTVAVHLYRPEQDDFCTTTVHGSQLARETLLGDARGWDVWGAVLDARFLHRGTYLVPHGTFDWNELAPHSYVPEVTTNAAAEAWHPEDALLVPLRHSDGHLLGILAVDEPVSGMRPGDDDLDVLLAVADHAALALQSAQESAIAARHRSALEQLLHVSSQLTETFTIDAILQAVCDGIHEALGFESVSIDLPEPDGGRLAPRACYGWDVDDPAINSSMSLDELAPLLAPEFEIEGCYLLTSEEALARLDPMHTGYHSRLTGRGPHAWDDHWLLVPLYDRSGGVIGLIWTDDPLDRMLPSPARLQALRVFANQATTALDSAAQFEEMRFLADHDPLTRLFNRRSFNDRLEVETARAARYQRPFALVLGDVDGLKELNDRLGHMAGDRALEAIGRVLQEGRREVDAVFRIGGDEFALILPEVGEDEARSVIERITETIRATEDERLKGVAISFGLAVHPDHGGDPERLFRAADLAMYGAKRPGRPGRLPFAS